MGDIMFDPGSLAGGIASSIGSIISGNKTNKTNLRIAREANALQERLFHEANDFNANQAQLDREWQEHMSDPEFQKERLLAAGYNPNMIGDTSSGVSGSSASSASIPSMTAPSMNPVPVGDFGLLSITDGMANALGVQKARQELRKINLENDFIDATFDSRVAVENARATIEKEAANFATKTAKYKVGTAKWDYAYTKYKARKEKVLYKQVKQQIRQAKEDFDFSKTWHEKEIEQVSEQIKNIIKQRDVMDANIKSSEASAALARSGVAVNEKQGNLLDKQGQALDEETRIKRDQEARAVLESKINQVITGLNLPRKVREATLNTLLAADLNDTEIYLTLKQMQELGTRGITEKPWTNALSQIAAAAGILYVGTKVFKGFKGMGSPSGMQTGTLPPAVGIGPSGSSPIGGLSGF